MVNKKATKKHPATKRATQKAVPKRAAKQAAPKHASTQSKPVAPSTAYYRLNTFLHTLRVIAGHEDQLCTLLHAMRQEGTASDAMKDELRDLLDEIPSSDYIEELVALRNELTPSRSAKPAKSAKRKLTSR